MYVFNRLLFFDYNGFTGIIVITGIKTEARFIRLAEPLKTIPNTRNKKDIIFMNETHTIDKKKESGFHLIRF